MSHGRPLPPPGRIAWFDGRCPICDQLIQRLVHSVIRRKGEWIHVHCAERE